jgi:hypothetical protein
VVKAFPGNDTCFIPVNKGGQVSVFTIIDYFQKFIKIRLELSNLQLYVFWASLVGFMQSAESDLKSPEAFIRRLLQPPDCM